MAIKGGGETLRRFIRPVTLIEETQNAYKHLIKKSRAKRSKEVTEALDTDGKMLQKWILKKKDRILCLLDRASYW